jgi:toxin secretion/phage lysis holin
MKTKLVGLGGVALGALGVLFKEYWLLFSAVTFFMVLDVITGVMKGAVNNNLSSKIGAKGFIKRIGYFISLSFCIGFDYFSPLILAEVLGIETSNILVFSSCVAGYLILNDAFSILENLLACGVPLPQKIIDFLGGLKK